MYRRDWYVQAVSQRGRVMTFRIDELPPPKDQSPRGYVADASDELGKWIKGGTRIYLRDGTRSSVGPVSFAKGVADAEAELPPSRARPAAAVATRPAAARPVSRPTALASTVPSQMDVRLTERDLSKVLAELSKPIAAAEPQSAFMLVQPLAPSAARASTLDFESPPLTLAPSLEPGKAERDDSRPRLGAMALGGGAVGRALGGGSAPNISFSEFTGGMRWPTFNYQAVFLPHWLVLGAVSLPAVFAMAGVLRRGLLWFRRKRSGLCVACGYDLRAAVGGRCPECGKIGSGQFVGEMSPPPQSPAADVR